MIRLVFVSLLAVVIGCSGGGSGSGNDSGAESGNDVSWTIAVDTTGSGSPLNPALLGHYDLSGVLYDHSNVPGLAAAMSAAGFSEWRIGAGRWEQATELLPILTDTSTCPPTSGIFSTTASTDEELMAARDWFIYTDGSVVSLGDTVDDGRYDLGYIRSVIDTAESFGATPYISIDHMPRALSINQTANREDCGTTFMNAVSNNQPQDVAVFASAVRGMVQRVVEGTGTRTGAERPRNVRYWEVWNEPEFLYFWQPGWKDPSLFFDMAVPVLGQLDAYRTNSGHSELKFGLGSFAFDGTAVAVLSAFDAVPVPMDFISFHGYDDDPVVLVDKINAVAMAAQNSTHYKDIEMVLAEWGPDLAARTHDQAYAASMGPPLHAATVIALGAAVGLDRTHNALFYNYHPTIALGLVDNNGQPRTLYRCYELMAKVIVTRAERLSLSEFADGRLDAGMGAVLVSRDGSGAVRILLVNRNSSERTAIVELDGSAATPNAIYTLDGTDDPLDPLRTIAPTEPRVVMTANSMMVLVF